MRLTWALITGLLLGPVVAVAFEPGEKLVTTQPVEMKTITGSTVALTPGTTLTVRAVEPDRLRVAAGRVGWIDPSAVIAASAADDYFSKLIESNPQDSVALMARGKIRFLKADLDLAIADFDQSLKLAPNSEAHTIRGHAWKRKGDKDKAMADFNEAIQLNPREAMAWRVRGATWAGKADYAKALADYAESIRIDPENPDSRHHRAMMLASCTDAQYRNGKQAVEDATKACEVSDWSSSLYVGGLAIAYAELGDFDSAVKWQTKAMEVAPPDQAKGMQNQIENFRQHKPVRTTWR